MSKILMASVPTSGHVNPGLPIARRLVERGHEVVWYCGSRFGERITATGARFAPFRAATDFDDATVGHRFGPIHGRSLTAHVKFCIRHVFYGPMAAYYADMKEILKDFDADVIVSDEWFTGGIPFSEKKEKKWIIYGSTPLMVLDDDAPTPGTGMMPDSSKYGRYRDKIAKIIFRLLFRNVEKDINALRAKIGLPAMTRFFVEQTVADSVLALKFTTEAFEFPRKRIPPNIRFVGPVLPETDADPKFSWMDRLTEGRPVVFITQGSVDNDLDKLILPSLKALRDENVTLVVSTGGRPAEGLQNRLQGRNVIFEPYIPYAHVMPRVSVMITNGGYGGVSTALSYGVPLVVAGNSEDKPEIASRIVYCGAGIDLKTDRPSARKIRTSVTKILRQPSFRRNAERVRDDFAKHDAVKESVDLIEGILAGKG
jgi:MGT family glycosyltransferase